MCVSVCVVGKPKGRVDSTVIQMVDAETWDIILNAVDGVSETARHSTKRGFGMSTQRLALLRRTTESATVTVTCESTAAVDSLSRFLGFYWNVSVPPSLAKTAAMHSEKLHAFSRTENVRAVVDLGDSIQGGVADNTGKADDHAEKKKEAEARLRALEISVGIDTPGATSLSGMVVGVGLGGEALRFMISPLSANHRRA